MTAVFTSPEDIINDALVRIGVKLRIGSIYDGSAPAKVALDIYGQTRDQMLRDGDWGFARGDVTMTLLKSAPAGGYITVAWSNTYPPLPYRYEYEYPDDCLKVRAIRAPQLFIPDFDPQPVVFDTPNDTIFHDPDPSTVEKVIVCNVQNAILTYTRQVTDPATWEASFTEAFCAQLGRRLAPALASLELAKIEAGDEQIETAAANVTQG